MGNPLSGQPLIVAAKTTASADDALAVLSPRANRTAGELVGQCFRTRTAALEVIVDCHRKRVIATESESIRDAVVALLTAETWATVAPEAAGLLSHWNVTANPGALALAEYFHPTNRRGIEQIIDHFAQVGSGVFLLASQSLGNVHIALAALPSVVSDDVAAIALSGFSVTFELTPKPGYTPQAFE